MLMQLNVCNTNIPEYLYQLAKISNNSTNFITLSIDTIFHPLPFHLLTFSFMNDTNDMFLNENL